MSDIQRAVRILLRISSGEWTKKALAEQEGCHTDTVANVFAHLRKCGINIECTGYPDYRFFAARGGDWWVKSIPKNDRLAVRRELRIEKISAETKEEKAIRLAKDREYQRRYYPNLSKRRQALRSEMVVDKEVSKIRAERREQKRREDYLKRKANETPEARQTRLEKARKYSKEYYHKFKKK